MTIPVRRLSVSKTVKNVVNPRRGSVIWSPVMSSGGLWLGYSGAARNVQGKDGEKHHIHSALSSSFDS